MVCIKKVIVDDHGDAQCDGEIEWHVGDLGFGYCPKSNETVYDPSEEFCGGATCVGAINATCHGMGIGCHGG